MSLIKEFKDFINKGNVIDLAVAVVLGKAFGDIVNTVVTGVVMPVVGVVSPSGDWQHWHVWKIQIGAVLAAVINFLVIAFVVFIAVNKLMKFKKKPEAQAPAATPEDVLLLREIRDALARR